MSDKTSRQSVCGNTVTVQESESGPVRWCWKTYDFAELRELFGAEGIIPALLDEVERLRRLPISAPPTEGSVHGSSDETAGFKAPQGVGPEPADSSAGTTPAPNWYPIGSEPRDIPLLCYWAPIVPKGPSAIGDAVHSSIGDGWHRPGYITEELNTPTYWMSMPVVPSSAVKASDHP